MFDFYANTNFHTIRISLYMFIVGIDVENRDFSLCPNQTLSKLILNVLY